MRTRREAANPPPSTSTWRYHAPLQTRDGRPNGAKFDGLKLTPPHVESWLQS